MEYTFPQYRKLEGFGRFYKILHERAFEEVSLVNETVHRSLIEAKQYPEMLRIKDMLDQNWNFTQMLPAEIALYFND